MKAIFFRYTTLLIFIFSGFYCIHCTSIKEKNINVHSNLTCTDQKQSALNYAAFHGRIQVLKALIKSGAHRDSQDNYNRTPLFYGALAGHLAVVEYLVSIGADTTVTDNQKNTALHAAAYGGHDKVVSFLLTIEMDANARNLSAETPLHQAAKKGHSKTVEILLTQGKANVEARAVDFKTALHNAVRVNNTAMIECLLDHKAPMLVIDNFGKTPLDCAQEKQLVEATCLLMQRYTSRNLERYSNIFIFGDDTFVTKILWGLLDYLVNDAKREMRDFFHNLSIKKIEKVTNKAEDWLKTPLGQIWHIIHLYTSPYSDPHHNSLDDAQRKIWTILEKMMPKDLTRELFTFLPAPWHAQKKRSREETEHQNMMHPTAKRRKNFV